MKTPAALVASALATADAAERCASADAAFADAFAALAPAQQAPRWRGLDHGSKFRLVVRRIEDLGKDWQPSIVEEFIAKYDARFAAGPFEAAVEGALERLADESSCAMRLARAGGDKAGGTFWQRSATSYTNALLAYQGGIRPARLASGYYLLPSRRAGEAPHIVRMDESDWACSCAAGASMHWPIALVVGIEVAQDAMQREDDGDTDAALVAQAAPIIDALDRVHGDCDFEADCDAPAPLGWRIGAVVARLVQARCPLGDRLTRARAHLAL